MNKLVMFAFVCLIISVVECSPQWNNNQQPQFPPQGFPDINQLCKQNGNCKTESRFAEESSNTNDKGQNVKFTRVCDDKGCYEKKVTSGSSMVASTNLILMLASGTVAVLTMFVF